MGERSTRASAKINSRRRDARAIDSHCLSFLVALVQFKFSVLFCQDFLPLEWLHFRINMKTQRSLVSSLRGIVLVLTWQIIYEGMNERFEAVLIII